MTWPFRSVRVRLLERDVTLLQARIHDLEAQVTKAREDEQYFRTRYERLADAVLVVQGVSATPVHVQSAKPVEGLGSRVMRAAALAGNPRGVDFSKGSRSHASAADLPS